MEGWRGAESPVLAWLVQDVFMSESYALRRNPARQVKQTTLIS